LADRSPADIKAKISQVKVLTVDSFQGSEMDIVILSFVRSNPTNKVGFLSDFSRINVAVTRAKHILLCVGNARTLEYCGLPFLAEMINDARRRGKLVSSRDIAIDGVEDASSLIRKNLKSKF
jgi:superfamily I DNA and/or RNA helicase